MSGKTTDPATGCLGLNQSPEPVIKRLLIPVGFASGYVIFALGCCLLMATAAWLNWREKQPDQRVRRLRQRVSRLCKWYLYHHTTFGQIAVDYHHLRRLGPGLIIANHPSLVDALWILATQPHVCCVLKADLMQSWLLRYLVTSLNYVSNKDPELLLQEGTRRLADGETLLVFPEATRTQPGRLPVFRLGAAELLVRSGATAHPVIIYKRGAYLSKTRAWYQFPSQRQHWRIDFAESFQPAVGNDPRADRRRITAELQDFFHQRLGSTAVAPARQAAEN